jgi:hypothetical protein
MVKYSNGSSTSILRRDIKVNLLAGRSSAPLFHSNSIVSNTNTNTNNDDNNQLPAYSVTVTPDSNGIELHDSDFDAQAL